MKQYLLLAFALFSVFITNAQLNEDFDGGTFPPVGWIVAQTGNSGSTWQATTASMGSAANGSTAAFLPWQTGSGPQNDYLISKQFTPTATNRILSYYVRTYQPISQGSVLRILVSTDSVQNNLASYTMVSGPFYDYYDVWHGGYQHMYADLSNYIGQQIYVAFHIDQFNGDDWSIDAISTQQCGKLDTISVYPNICLGNSFTMGTHAYTASGTYVDTLTTVYGCDSVVTTHLTVTPITTSLSQTICAGSTFNFNGTVLNASGIYKDTLTNANGCDSIITLNLNVIALPICATSASNSSPCAGDSIKIDATIMNRDLSFDGVDDAINCGNISSFDGANKFTIEAMVYNSAAGSTKTIFTRKTSSTNGFTIGIDASNAVFVDLGTYWNYAHALTNANTFSPNAWHHLAVVYDASLVYPNSQLEIYIDGVSISESFTIANPPAYLQTSGAAFIIGSEPTGSSSANFQGKLNDVRVWNIARDASAIATYSNTCLPNTNAGLVARYLFDEAANSVTTQNAVSNTYTGYLYNFDSSTCWNNSSIGCSSSNGITISNGIVNQTFFVPSISNTYTVTATNAFGCTSTTTIAITTQTLPTLTVSSTLSLACYGAGNTLHASGTGINYNWGNGIAGPDTTIIQHAGTYTVTAYSTAGCTKTATIVIAQSSGYGTAVTNVGATSATVTQVDGQGFDYVDNTCNKIAYVQDAAGGNSLGPVTATVTLDSTVGNYGGNVFVRRKFSITPTSQGAAQVTLYFTQADFDDYNVNCGNAPKMPLNQYDYLNQSNVKVTKVHGGTLGIGSNSVLVPNYVYYDANSSLWEVNISIDSFSEFYLHTVDSLACVTKHYYESKSICDGDSYVFNNNSYSIGGTYIHTFINQYGCDSIVHFTLTIKQNPIIDSITASTNNLCIGDSSTIVLHSIVPSVTVSSPVGLVSGTLDAPISVAVDAQKNIYTADKNRHVIYKTDISGNTTIYAGVLNNGGNANGPKGSATFYFIQDIALDNLGNIFVTELYSRRIRKISSAGIVSNFAGDGYNGGDDGSATTASFYSPHSLAIDQQNNIYVSEDYPGTIRKIDNSGFVTTIAGTAYNTGYKDTVGTFARFNTPRGIDVDKNGNVYVADNANRRIRVIDPSGKVTTLAGNGTYGSTNGNALNASFSTPQAVTVDELGNVYVLDFYDYSIRKIGTDSMVTTLVGNGYGNMNGNASTAKFGEAYDMNKDALGNLYLADNSNRKIRKVTIIEPVNITWLPTTNTSVLSNNNIKAWPNASTVYTATAVDIFGCSVIDSININNSNTGDLVLASSNNTASNTGNTTIQFVQHDGATHYYTDANCNLLATIADVSDGIMLDSVTVSTQVNNSLPNNSGLSYSPRWFTITPLNQGDANITLYQTQSDFDAYNVWAAANSKPQLPNSSSDFSKINNIRITKLSGGTFGTGTETIIAPTVQWDSVNNYWSLQFTVSSFSEFYVHSLPNIPLALGINLSGKIQDNTDHLTWTSNEGSSVTNYELQEMQNVMYKTIANVNASTGINTYNFSNVNPKTSNYRIVASATNGTQIFSNIIKLSRATINRVELYPNPATSEITLDIYSIKNTNATIKILDVTGKLVQQIQTSLELGTNKNTIDISYLANGIYTVKVSDGRGWRYELQLIKN
jgi:hypothetical protein